MSFIDEAAKACSDFATPLQSAWAARPPVKSKYYLPWGKLFTKDINSFIAAYHSIPQSGPPIAVPNFLLAVLQELFTYRQEERRVDPGNMQPDGEYPPHGRLIKDESYSFWYQADGWWQQFAPHSSHPAVQNAGNLEDTRHQNGVQGVSNASLPSSDPRPAETVGPHTRASKRRRKSTSEPDSGAQLDEHHPSEVDEAAHAPSTRTVKRRRKGTSEGDSGGQTIEALPEDIEEGTKARPSRASKRRKTTSEGDSGGDSEGNTGEDVGKGMSARSMRAGKRCKTGEIVANDAMDRNIPPAPREGTEQGGLVHRLRSRHIVDQSTRVGPSSVSGSRSSGQEPCLQSQGQLSPPSAPVEDGPVDVVSEASQELLADTWDFNVNDVPDHWVPSSRRCSNCAARSSTCRVNIAHGTSCNFCMKNHRNCDISPPASRYPSSTDRAWLFLEWLRKPADFVPSQGAKKKVKIPNWFRPALKKASGRYTKARKAAEDRIVAVKPTYFGDNVTGGRKRSFIPQSDQEEDGIPVASAQDQTSNTAEGPASGASTQLGGGEAATPPGTHRATRATRPDLHPSQPAPGEDVEDGGKSASKSRKGKEREKSAVNDGLDTAVFEFSAPPDTPRDVSPGVDLDSPMVAGEAEISNAAASAGDPGVAMGSSSGRGGRGPAPHAPSVASNGSSWASSSRPLTVRPTGRNDKSLPTVKSILAACQNESRMVAKEPDDPRLSPPAPFSKDNPAINFQLSLLPNRKIDMELSPQFEWETGDLIGPSMPFADPVEWDRPDSRSATLPALGEASGTKSNVSSWASTIALGSSPSVAQRPEPLLGLSSSMPESRQRPSIAPTPHARAAAQHQEGTRLALNSPMGLPVTQTPLLGSPSRAAPASMGTGLSADAQGSPQSNSRAGSSGGRADSRAKASDTWLTSTHVRASKITPDLWGVERGGSYLSLVDSINHDLVALSMEARILWDATLLLGGEGARACWRIKSLEETWERWSQDLENSFNNTSNVLSDIRKLLSKKDHEIAAQSARIGAIEAYLRNKDPSGFVQSSADDSGDDGDDEEYEPDDPGVSGTSPRESAVGDDEEIDELVLDDAAKDRAETGDGGELYETCDGAEDVPEWTSLSASPGPTAATEGCYPLENSERDGVCAVPTTDRNTPPVRDTPVKLSDACSAVQPLNAGEDTRALLSSGQTFRCTGGTVQHQDSVEVSRAPLTKLAPSLQESPGVSDPAPAERGLSLTPLWSSPTSARDTVCSAAARPPSDPRGSPSSPIPQSTGPSDCDTAMSKSAGPHGESEGSLLHVAPASDGESPSSPFCSVLILSLPSSPMAVDDGSSDPLCYPALPESAPKSHLAEKARHAEMETSSNCSPAADIPCGNMAHINKSPGDTMDEDNGAADTTVHCNTPAPLDRVAGREHMMETGVQ